MKNVTFPRLRIAAAVLVAGVLFAAPALACMGPNGCRYNCNNGEDSLATLVTFPEPGKALITFTGYETTDVEPNNSCIVALPPVDGVLAVRTVVNHDSGTGEPLGWVDFAPSKVPGRELARLAEDLDLAPDASPWHGFLTRVTADIDAGDPNHFVIEVTLDPNRSIFEFLDSLRRDGIWATSSSDALGNPTPDHNHFERISEMELIVVFPSP
ncbi:MAG: hypothetical protein AAF481_19530 [Acidobacteriota bacterium]